MKRLILIVLLWPIMLFAQKTNETVIFPSTLPEGTPIPVKRQGLNPATGKYVMEDVINVNGSKNGLYNRALAFLAKNLNNANYTIQFRDKETGKIVTNSLVKVLFENVSANITLLFEDNKFKYIITDFKKNDYGINAYTWPGWSYPVSFLLSNYKKKQEIGLDVFKRYENVMENLRSEIKGKKKRI